MNFRLIFRSLFSTVSLELDRFFAPKLDFQIPPFFTNNGIDITNLI